MALGRLAAPISPCGRRDAQSATLHDFDPEKARMTIMESLSLAIDWPTAGWIGVGIVVSLAVAIVAVEVSGEIHRKRRIARRISAFSRHGKLHGQGVKTFSDGSRYEGEFQNGRMHGRGMVTFSNGTRYEGEWRDGDRHGEGIVTLPDGTRL